MKIRNALIIILVAVMLVMAGCSGGGGTAGKSSTGGSVAVKVAYPQDQKAAKAVSVSYYTIDIYETTDVEPGSTVVEGKTPVVSTTRLDYPQDTASIGNVPIGDKTLVIFGFDADGNKVLFSSSLISVIVGDNEPVSVTLNEYGPEPEYPPVITSISPMPAAKGSTVTITGQHFGDTQDRILSIVYFAGIAADTYISWSDTEIQCVVPDCPDGPVSVDVGGVISNEVAFSRQRVWGAPVIIDSGSGTDYMPQIDMDPDGNAICVFKNTYDVYANYYSGGWSTYQTVWAGSPFAPSNHQVAMGQNGSAYATFAWNGPAYASLFNPSTLGWSVPAKINALPVPSGDVSIALNSASKPYATYVGNDMNPYYNTTDPLAVTWPDTADVPLSTSTLASESIVKIGPTDDVFFVYEENGSIFARVLSGGVLQPAGTSATNMSMGYIYGAVGGDNILTMVYSKSPSGIYANRFDPTTNTWAGEVLINGTTAGDIAVAADENGNVMVIYQVSNDVYSRYYNSSTGTWDAEQQMNPAGSTTVAGVDVKFDKKGNAYGVFSINDGVSQNVYTSIWLASSSMWGTSVRLHQDSAAVASQPKIVVDKNQNAICVYQTSAGTGGVHGVRYE